MKATLFTGFLLVSVVVACAAEGPIEEVTLPPAVAAKDLCPKQPESALEQGRTCLKQCDSDADCKSKRKRCLCDNICGLSCIKQDPECQPVSSPENGQVKSETLEFGTRAFYSCDKGFQLVGSEQRLCQADGTWTSKDPECRKAIYCEDPPAVPNARHNASKNHRQFRVNDELHYSCFPGYQTKGFITAKCIFYNGTARWFGPDVECTPISCGNPGEILNGYRSGDSFLYGSRVTYQCMDGFEITGRQNRYCKDNGQWSSVTPTCRAVHCPTPEDPLNGRAMYTSTSFNSLVTYQCRNDHVLVGDARRRCGPDKQWSGDAPYCKGGRTPKPSEIDCGSPGVLHQGWLEGSSTNLGSVVIFRCLDGMKYEGSHKSTTCQADGKWSHPLPKCLAPCLAPTIENGSLNNSEPGAKVEHGRDIIVECDEKYEIVYNATPSICDNGTWTIIHKCTPERCKTLPKKPRNGMVIAPKTDHGMRAMYKCKDGYIIYGSNITECRFGQWEGTEPYCVEIYCPYPGSIENGKVLLVGNMGLYDYRPYVRKVSNNRQIMYECDRGFILSDGPPGATCIGGRWSPKQMPRCVLGMHPRLRWYRSVPSTDLSTTRVRRQADLSTTKVRRRAHTSKVTPCSPLPDVPYMRVQVVRLGKGNESMPHGTKLDIACIRGYGLNLANRTAKCVRGRWRPRTPQCTPLPCKVPPGNSGHFYHDDMMVEEMSGIAHGQVITFSCAPGYQVHGAESIRCWSGDWAVGSYPECTPAPCELPQVANGQYSGGYRAGLTIAHGSHVEYECEAEYVKTTMRLITCHMGELKPRVPGCRQQDVHIIPVAQKGPSGVTPMLVDDIQKTDTQFNFKQSSDSEGNSDVSAIKLSASSDRACGPPERVQNALVYREGLPLNEKERRFPDGTEVHFNCITGITGERTSWKIACQDGTWIGLPHRCETGELNEEFENVLNRSCPFRNSEQNVQTFHGDMLLGVDDVIEFPPSAELVSRCLDIGKFAFIGSVRRRCVNGEWDGVKPVCFGLSQENDYALEKPPTILFRHQLGPIAQSNDGKMIVYPGTILHLECLWIRKYGTPRWEVSHTYRKYPEGWTNDPKRDSQLEYRLSIYHAQRDDSGIYTCITPMGHRHSVEIVVRAVHCPRLPERRGLQLSSPSNKMNTIVIFSCKNGNALIGPDNATCLPSGSWSAHLPICESVRCPDTIPTEDTSVQVQILSREVGGRAVFKCEQGHGLRGPSEAFCENSGMWSALTPQCEEVHCSAPDIPENGYIQGTGTYRFGDIVQFNCNQGFMMDGAAIIACQESGRWSRDPPKCVRACPYPGTTPGIVISTVKFYYGVAETVTFDCSKGMQLQGARMLRCLPNGKWSNAMPVCLPAET